MTADEIAVSAAQNTLPSEKLSLAENLLWYRLRDLYQGFAKGAISKEKAAEEKKKVLKQYNSDRQKEADVARYFDYHAALYKSIESAATAYKENKTIENADKFVEAVYGVKMKEE